MRCLAALTLLALGCAGSPPRTPSMEKADLFRAGDNGYALYRIPGIVVTAKGTVLVYSEARKTASGDWNQIDLVLRRSVDGGRSFDPAVPIGRVDVPIQKNPVALKQKLAKAEEVTTNNPVAIADRSGAVHFLFCIEYMRCFYMRSDDDGRSFSTPVEITSAFDAFRPDYDWKVLATGPGHGIQLRGGRLVVPVWLSTGTGGHAHRPSIVSVIHSDDSGKTWKRGDVAAWNTPELVNPNETSIAELSDGRVLLNIRSESKEHRRAVTISQDGATKWSTPRFDPALLEPICMASLLRPSGSTLLFANPDTLEPATKKPGQSRDRRNLSVKVSDDDGATWPVSRTIEAGLSGYSDLAALPDGTILCYYERGSTDGNPYRSGSLCLARFNLEWARELRR